jgi:hypothetical protein
LKSDNYQQMDSKPTDKNALPTIGWKEWGALPALGINRVRLKIDTGAKTSALHAVDLEYFEQKGQQFVSFFIYSRSSKRTSVKPKLLTTENMMTPSDNSNTVKKSARQRIQAEVVRFTIVKSSNGIKMRRPVIRAELSMGIYSLPIELSLVDRSMMGHKILVGRSALAGRFVVDSQNKYLISGQSPSSDATGRR